VVEENLDSPSLFSCIDNIIDWYVFHFE
jgi:hypothetical protein